MFQEEINGWAKQFRVLNDWVITYDSLADYKGQCTINTDRKMAWIYTWGDILPQPKDYIFHEVLHVAQRAAKKLGREGEELLVQDICSIIWKNKSDS